MKVRDYVPIALAKLLLHPLLVWRAGQTAIALGVPLALLALTGLVRLAALPSASNVSLLLTLKNEIESDLPIHARCATFKHFWWARVNHTFAEALWLQSLIGLSLDKATPEGITMKSQLRVLAVTVGLFCAATGFAQTTTAPATKPSAVVNAPVAPAVKESAAPAVKTPAAAAAVAPAVTPAAPMAKTGAAPTAKTAATKTAAVGGGDGKVWVNTKSKAYHCEGTKFYGKTTAGEYMAEADAKAKGYHADHGKACAK